MAKIAALALCTLVFGGVVRRGAPELALLLSLCAGVGVLALVTGELEGLAAELERLAQLAGLEEELVGPVLKTVAISLMTRITGEICRCGGEGGLAACVDTAGVILSLWVALPLAEGVLMLMGQLMT